MRTFEMCLVFILSATLLSVHGGIDEYNNTYFKHELLRLHNGQRALFNLGYLELEDDEPSEEVKQRFQIFILENHVNGLYAYTDDLYVILVLLTETPKMTAHEVFDAIKQVCCSNTTNVHTWNTNKRVVFIPIEVAKKYNEKEQWMVAIYEKATTSRDTVIPVNNDDDDVFTNLKKMEGNNNENIEENQVNDLIKILLNESDP